MERKYLSFRTDISDEEGVVYSGGKLYEITFEDEDNYYTGQFEAVGISKDWDGIKYTVIPESMLYSSAKA